MNIDYKYYQGRILGKKELFNPVTCSPQKRLQTFGSTTSVYINASFFNSNQFFSSYPESATIGPAKTQDDDSHINIPVAEEYKDDYCLLEFENSDYICTAPLLTKYGLLTVDVKKYGTPPFQYNTLGGKQCPPGSLFHFGDPNPRAGIAFPAKNTTSNYTKAVGQDKIRLAVALATIRGSESDGCTIMNGRQR